MGTYFVDLPDFASSVNSIQVQRGIGTSSNGAGAFGGTINLATNEYREKVC
jgi:iron complex outermembrane receptor protein